MKNWNELRVAYQIGLHGTVSEAAKNLGVHRSTVIRQLDGLEKELGQKLFLRHQHGYTLTDTGKEYMQMFRAANDQIEMGIGMIKSKSSVLSGEIVVTALHAAFRFLSLPVKSFLIENPNICVRFEASPRKFKLEYGEAHIAVRTGPKPTEPDYVVQPFSEVRLGLYASKCYCSRFGIPKHEREFSEHHFVVSSLVIGTAIDEWDDIIPKSRTSFSCEDPGNLEDAIRSGIGIGFMPEQEAKHDANLIEVMPNRDDWTIPIWLVTHADQHRTPKIQACLRHLKEWAQEHQP